MKKKLSHILGLSLMLWHLPSFAVKPVQGWYAGVFLGPTYTPNIDFFGIPRILMLKRRRALLSY
ncbi:MAG TPA: hypothetical protein VHD33_06185 [Legionellaceae bacterium]|nr:hypothetical protein [Legionellaceae bacterium]